VLYHYLISDCRKNGSIYLRNLVKTLPFFSQDNLLIYFSINARHYTLLPEERETNQKHWLVPISAQRVQSNEKGNEVGMQQIIHCIQELELTDELNISLGDSLYGTEVCRATAASQENLIPIFRIKRNRNIFSAAADSKIVKRGRKKV